MTNQEKFIQIFGIDAWKQLIVFSTISKQFEEYWTSPYKAADEPYCKGMEESDD